VTVWFGTEFDNMKTAKPRFKLVIRGKDKPNVNSFSDSLNDALNSEKVDCSWRLWRAKFVGSQQSGMIDGYCAELDTADRYAEVFKDATQHSRSTLAICAHCSMNGLLATKGSEVSP